MRSSHSRSRSRGHRGSRKSPDRNYNKRSASRSGSRGRKSGGDPGKRRSKFSDPSGPGSMGGSSRGFSGGFHEDQDPYQNRGGYGGRPQNGGYGQQRYEEPSGYQGNQQHQQGGNGGVFSYNNVRQSNAYDDFDIDKAVQIQKPDASFGRSAPGQGGFDPQENIDQYVSTTGVSSLRQGTKIQRKVFIPQDGKFNYIGLIIGPKGSNQKQLEEQTHCKILIRGKGSQKAELVGIHPEETEDLHVLIEADTEQNVTAAMREIENILFMNEDEKEKKRDLQLRSAHAHSGGRGDPFVQETEGVTFIQVHNNIVGLIIGRKGETIKQIRDRSGADRVYMQNESSRDMNSELQNLIVEGSRESVNQVREIIEDIKNQQKRKQGGGGGGSNECRVEMEIPPNLAGLVIGKQGSTLQQIGQQTRTRCQILQNQNGPEDPKKILVIVGQSQEDCNQAKAMFEEKMTPRQPPQGSSGPRFQGGYGGPPNRGGPHMGGGGGGRPPFNNNRRPRRNADGDEIVEDQNQFDYYPSYPPQDPMMGGPNMYGMPPMYQQYQPYPGNYGMVPPQPEIRDQEGGAGQVPSEKLPGQEGDNGVQPQQMGDQQLQMQLEMQKYQQYMYQQMYMQQQPVIEEVLADGTVVSMGAQNADDEERKRGRRGGRR